MNKYKVTEGLMNELNEWNKNIKDEDLHMDEIPLDEFPILVDDWIFTKNSVLETINRLITIMHFVNGEDVFIVENPSYIVRVKGDNGYINVEDYHPFSIVSDKRDATVFYRLEEAKQYENAVLEVVTLDE